MWSRRFCGPFEFRGNPFKGRRESVDKQREMEPVGTLAPFVPYACVARAGAARPAPAQAHGWIARPHLRRDPDGLPHGAPEPPRPRGDTGHGARARQARRPPPVGDRGRPRFVLRGERAPGPRRGRPRAPARGGRLPQVEAPHRPGGAHRWRGVRPHAPGDGRARRVHRCRAPAARDSPHLCRRRRARDDQLRGGHKPDARRRRRRPAARRRSRGGGREGARQRPHGDLQRRGGPHARASPESKATVSSSSPP